MDVFDFGLASYYVEEARVVGDEVGLVEVFVPFRGLVCCDEDTVGGTRRRADERAYANWMIGSETLATCGASMADRLKEPGMAATEGVS